MDDSSLFCKGPPNPRESIFSLTLFDTNYVSIFFLQNFVHRIWPTKQQNTAVFSWQTRESLKRTLEKTLRSGNNFECHDYEIFYKMELEPNKIYFRNRPKNIKNEKYS